MDHVDTLLVSSVVTIQTTVNLGYNDMVFAQDVYRYTANIVIANDHYSEDYE